MRHINLDLKDNVCRWLSLVLLCVGSTALADHHTIRVTIDPGHGGHDSGAIDVNKRFEKNVTLAISKSIQKQLNHYKGFHASLTRDGDYFLDLLQRIEKADAQKADLLISIHADSFKKKSVRGVAVYTLSKHGASNEMAHWIVARQNKTGHGPKSRERYDRKTAWLQSVVFDVKQSRTLATSIRFAKQLIHAFESLHIQMHQKTVDKGAFIILTSPSIPSVLIETGFLSNPRDAHLLQKPWYRHRLARAITRAIVQSFSHHGANSYLIVKKKNGMYWIKHRIRKGETLSHLAVRYHTRVSTIMKHNNLKNSRNIQAGQTIMVPTQRHPQK